jgi:hypothetical protein
LHEARVEGHGAKGLDVTKRVLFVQGGGGSAYDEDSKLVICPLEGRDHQLNEDLSVVANDIKQLH